MDIVQSTALGQEVGSNVEKNAKIKTIVVIKYPTPTITFIVPNINGTNAKINAVCAENPRYLLDKNTIIERIADLISLINTICISIPIYIKNITKTNHMYVRNGERAAE
jgi:hypothetical protein